jgi:hypothetical protein
MSKCRAFLGALASRGGRALWFLMVIAAASTAAYAGGPLDAPEIDPGSMAGALSLLTCGVLMLTDRIRRRP